MSNRPRRPDTQPRTRVAPPSQTAGTTAPPAFFLRTKLLPPRAAPALLQRPRLLARLQTNLSQPVTLVTANAGSGKTTLVADFVRTHARPFVWYQLDQTDADPFVFLGYLVRGIKQHVAGFGAATLAYLQQATAEVAQQPERAVAVLLNEVLDLVEQQMIIVLDDYHHLGAETPVHAVVDRLLAYLPDVLHVIIISRDVPPLALARLRAQPALTIIDRAELLFTDDETQELFRRVFDLELTPAQLAEYRERTHGWITALQLVRQVAQRQALTHVGGAASAAPDLSEILRLSERDIFDYFAEEVFAAEALEVQQLLLHVALLERVEADVCARLHPRANCAMLLPTLVRRNVFLTVASDGRGEEFRLHPLFRAFLRRRLHADIGHAGVAAEHARYADYFCTHEQWEQAVLHLLAAEDYDRAAGIVAAKGAQWIATGAFAALVSFVAAIPDAVIAKYPRALTHRAEVARLRGEYDAAQGLFRRAAALLHEQADQTGEAEALHSLATIARRRGDFQTAFDYLDRAVVLTADDAPVRIKCGNTRGLCLFFMGRRTEAERAFREALQAAEHGHDDFHARLIAHNLGLPAMLRGDFGEALRWFRRMLPTDEQAQPLPQDVPAYLNSARCHLYRGDLAACEQHLVRALERCQLFNLTALSGEALETYGNLYRKRNDAPRAAEFYALAVRAYEQAGLEVWRFEVQEEQALLHLQTGEFAPARMLLDRLIAARTEAGNEAGRQTARLARGRVLLAQAETAAAVAELELVRQYFHEQRLYYYEAQACLTLAAAQHQTGAEPALLTHLRRALDLAARYDYEDWLHREIERWPALFQLPEVGELLPADLRERVPAPTTQADAPQLISATPAPVVLPKPTAELTLKLLGPIEIYRDPARPLAADAWPTKRARDILCFISSRRHRRAAKDTIIDTFWGEADFAAVEKNFHPTVSHIRKALNSRQPLKQNFLLYRDGDYLLNQDFAYSIDTEEFDQLVMAAAAARRAGQHARQIELYEQACALYRGDFMQGTYDEWVAAQRAYYREQHLRMLEALALAAQAAADWPRTLQLAQEILRADQFREDVYCMLLRAYSALGQRGAVKEQYELLRRLLHKELGVEPAAETQKLYHQLMT